MPTHIKLIKDFSTTHEREFWNEFRVLFEKEYSGKEENSVLIGNIVIGGKDLMDAVIIKKDAIIILDFKDGGGDIQFKEKEVWIRKDGSEIKGGSFDNPYLQMRYYKFKLKEFLDKKKIDYPEIDEANLNHINGLVLFRDNIAFDQTTLPGNLKPWFHISDKDNSITKIKSITTRTVNISNNSLLKIYDIFDSKSLEQKINENVTLVKKNKTIKETEAERIMDYYISCLEQEEFKSLRLKVNLLNGNLPVTGANFHQLNVKFNDFICKDQNEIYFSEDSIKSFIKAENAKPNPRNLFIGFSTIAHLKNKDHYIYPKYYTQIVKINDDENNFDYKRLNMYELSLNKYFLSRCGLNDREEIEGIVDETDKLKAFSEKEKSLTNLEIVNSDIVNLFPIIFYSEVSNVTYSLIKELGVQGLISNYHLRYLNNSSAVYLLNKNEITIKSEEVNLNNELEIISFNNSQKKAIIKSLTDKFTVVTGPPGTGKSQLVINILANAVIQDKKVLFASKNNKAVDVIKERFIEEVFNKDETHLKDLILRFGNKTETKKTLEQVQRVINHINDGKYDIDEDTFYLSVSELQKINTDLKINEELYLTAKEYSDYCECLNNVNLYSINTDFWKNELFDIDEKDLSTQLNELKRITLKNDLNILEKIILWIYPRFYFNKYNKKINEFRSNLPDLTRKYFDSTIVFQKYDLEELVIHFKKLKEIKTFEIKIKEIKEFILKNDIENIFKNDLNLASIFLNKFQRIQEMKISEIKLSRIPFSIKVLKNKLKRLVCEFRNTNSLLNFKNSVNSLVDNYINIKDFAIFMRNYEKYFDDMLNFMPIWSVTSLSVRHKIPLKKDIFDLVIIDEASQGDIPSAIPLFYRAKNVCVIGDDLQLKHISGLTIDEDFKIAEECGVPEVLGRYTEESLFDHSLEISQRSNIEDIFLEEHYRSHGDIMKFCNVNFYIPKKGRKMINKTAESKLIFTLKGLFWLDVSSNGKNTINKLNVNEADKIVEILNKFRLKKENEFVSFGITTPFRNQANYLQNTLFRNNINTSQETKVLGDTIHKFQGDERDVILISPVISMGATNSMKNFINITAPQLLNVAISRGRSAVIIVGDRDECLNSGGLLSSLVNSAELIDEKSFYKL